MYACTIKIVIDQQTKKILESVRSNTVFLFWHNRLFLIWKIYKYFNKQSQMFGLVSPSKDGAWLSELFETFNIKTIRGSSKRHGSESLNEMNKILQNTNNCIAITPDGPRGPVYKIKPGAAILAKNNTSNVAILQIHYKKFWSLKTWDNFQIPKPFSSATVKTEFLKSGFTENLSIEQTIDFIQKKLEKTI